MKLIKAIAAAQLMVTTLAFAGGELPETDYRPAKRYARIAEQPVRAEAPVAKKVTGNSIEGSGIHKYGFDVQRNLPMPAPNRCMGYGKEFNEFYGPTYYDPWSHNNWERLNPTYYPFFHPTEWPNYKAP